MFGDKRGKAVDAIVDGLKPVIRFSAMHGGLPAGYWQDPYVLGFIQGCVFKIGEHAGLKTDSASAWIEAYEQLSDGQGKAVVTRIRELNRPPRDKDLLLGMGNAVFCVSYALGLEDYPDEPVIFRARKAGSDYATVFGHTDRKNPERTRTAGALVHILFHNIVSERLGH